MRGAVTVLAVLIASLTVCQAATRTYYIQAEKDWWSFAEDNEQGWYMNKCTGLNYSAGSELYMQVGVGSRYLHARYVRYMDENFTIPYEIPADEEHLSITGPLLRTVDGDTLEVVFRNTLEFETNLNPFGVELNENDTQPVGTNETTTYSWNITTEMAPPANVTSSKVWLYRPSIDDTVQQNMGLIGGLIVTRNDSANLTTARPLDTDIEFFTLFHVFDENVNLFFNETLEYYGLLEDPLTISNQTAANWEEANLMHSINGKMFCWNNGFNIPRGQKARWHVAVVGAEADIHNFHWHGMVLKSGGSYYDQFSLYPGSTVSADMITDNPGTWLLHCHVNDHIHAGMVGLYTLEGDPIQPKDQGDIIQKYIAANELEWDYVPYGQDMCGPEPADFSDDAAAVLVPNNFTLTMGNKQLKVMFEEYTDATFTKKIPKDPSLGIMGPTIHAKVGDTIKILFKNNARWSTSMHPHGVLYTKDSEGSPYNDGTQNSLKADDFVHTGQTWDYNWYVVDRSSPDTADGSSVIWMYHSHTHEIQDTYAGLMGAIIVTRREMAKPDNTPIDVDKEFVVGFSIINELSSFMLRDNLVKYMPSVPNLQYSNLAGAVVEFQDNENHHSINGYQFCNGPAFNASVGDRVRFYIFALGTEADLHTPSSSLQWLSQGRRASAIQSIPGAMQTADVVPRAAGEFTIQCRTTEHVDMGMIAKFSVEESETSDPWMNFNGTERVTYISADIEEWDYIPQDMDMCTGEEFDDEVSAAWGDGTMGKVFLKALYREYSDDTFTQKLPPQRESDGMAGPMLKGAVGDVITVVFLNNLTFPANLQVQGGLMPLHNASLIDSPVEPGDSVTYQWLIQEDNGPGEYDLSTIAYTYGSNVDATGDLNAGLFGVVVVARGGSLQENGLPIGVDKEIPTYWFGLDESASTLFDDNVNATNFTVPDDVTEYDAYTEWQATTVWQTLNGYVWCNQPNQTVNASSTVRWYLVGLGGETGLHSPIFENAVLLSYGGSVITKEIAPTVTVAVDMQTRIPGTWKYWCDTLEHYEGGMEGLYVVEDPNEQNRLAGNAE